MPTAGRLEPCSEESRRQRLFWLAEQIMNWSGVPVVHVRPTVLLDNPLFTVCCDGRHQGGWHPDLGHIRVADVATAPAPQYLAFGEIADHLLGEKRVTGC